MNEPPIQYATTSDGVSIAFSDSGQGLPLVYMRGPPFTHVQLEWRLPNYRRWFDNLLANGRRLITFDLRGSGLSDRDPAEISLEAYRADITAVLDRAGVERCALLAVQAGGVIAIDYTNAHPDRVSHLVLWDTYASGPAFSEVPQVKAFMGMLENDWDLFVRALGGYLNGWQEQAAEEFAEFVKHSVTAEFTRKFYLELMINVDVSPLLPKISQPTLVIHHNGIPIPPIDGARQVAARIPNAELLILDGNWESLETDMPIVERAIARLLGEPPKEPTPAPPTPPTRQAEGGMVTILFTDIEGSTALTQRLGDQRAREVFREHERIIREALREHGGSEVKSMGDGFMASFQSASSAIDSAIAMQQAFARHNADNESPISVRIGLNTGEPIAEQEDLFGTAVITASRIAAQAQGGEILASNVVRELVAGRGFLFSDRGETVLRGFEDPVRVFEVRWRENG